MYYFSVHLLYASIGGSAAWVLTSIKGASATTKYWLWVLAACNFVVPTGAIIDKLWAPHLAWAAPLGAIGGAVWDLTEGRTAVVLAVIWVAGGTAMLMRLIWRIRTELREDPVSASAVNNHDATSGVAADVVADGIPVSFDNRHPAPAVSGVLSPHILLPMGIDRLLDQREFDAVLLHELAHARRRDNLIRLLYELSLCALWFHPVMWLAGARMALYRELSCDEFVIRRAHGQALVSALAKLALPKRAVFLQASASSHLSDRLARLAEPPEVAHRGNLLVTSLFVAVILAGIFGTVAHTACCFLLK
jgi:beta-lactamase regulating signal transducer with metallopeptidase domain